MNIFTSIFLVTIGLLGSFSWLQTHRLNAAKMEYAEVRAQIFDLQQRSIEEAKHFSEAQKKAEEDMKAAQQKAQDIMNTKVPSGCDNAIKWGIKQAKALA